MWMKTLAVAVGFMLTAAVFDHAEARTGRMFNDNNSVTVSTLGLNFTAPTDMDRLHRRIIRAARDVCGVDRRLGSRSYSRALQCTRETVDDTVKTANIVMLSAVHTALDERLRYRSARGALSNNVISAALATSGMISADVARTTVPAGDQQALRDPQ